MNHKLKTAILGKRAVTSLLDGHAVSGHKYQYRYKPVTTNDGDIIAERALITDILFTASPEYELCRIIPRVYSHNK